MPLNWTCNKPIYSANDRALRRLSWLVLCLLAANQGISEFPATIPIIYFIFPVGKEIPEILLDGKPGNLVN